MPKIETEKIYCLIPDNDAVIDGDIRVIDESGEDYLYPSSYFGPIHIPHKKILCFKSVLL